MLRQTRQIGKQYIRATIDRATIDSDARTVDVVFVTERQCFMYDWFTGPFWEILPCNPQAGNLSRLNNGAPLLDTHDMTTVHTVLGVVEKAWFADNTGRATVRFSKREDVEPVWQDVLDGILTGISVGYIPGEYEEIGLREGLPILRANQWEALEITLCAVQADPDAGVGRSQQNEPQHNVTLIRKENPHTMKRTPESIQKILNAARSAGVDLSFVMPLLEGEQTDDEVLAAIEAKRSAPATPPATPPVHTPGNEPASAARAERERINTIRTAGAATGASEAFVRDLIDREVPIAEARTAIIDELSRRNPANPSPTLPTTINPGEDEADKKSRGMIAALLQRASVVPADQAGDPGEFRGMRMLDMARECLSLRGINPRGMNSHDIATRALSMSSTRDGGGGLATGDFGYILQNVLNKSLMTMFNLQQRTYLPWTRRRTAADFKNILVAQLNDLTITGVQAGGEYQTSALGDTGETYHVSKYGRLVKINWEAIVNDDLDAFGRIPTMLAGAVAQMQSNTVYGLITSSQLMGDGNQLFDATNHLNYTSSGTALSAASLAVGMQMFRNQKSPAGNILNITPKFLVVGAQNEMVARQLCSASYQPVQQSTINPWAGLLVPIIDARITGTAWYLIADPVEGNDTAEWATIDGQDIFTDSRYGFNEDAFLWKVRAVFGAKAIQWRSFYKNVGA